MALIKCRFRSRFLGVGTLIQTLVRRVRYLGEDKPPDMRNNLCSL